MTEVITQHPAIAIAGALVTIIGGLKIADWIQVFNNHLARRRMAADTEKVESEADKVDAEAEQVKAQSLEFITNAARSLVEPLEKRVTTLDAEVQAMRKEMHENDRLAAEHSGWDYIMEEKAREYGIPHPPRPPLRRSQVLYAHADTGTPDVDVDLGE